MGRRDRDAVAEERVLVARLVLDGLRGVTDEVLIDALWPSDVPTTAAKTLVGYVHRVRRALGHEAVVRQGSRYAIGAGVSVDAAATEEIVASARRAVVDGRFDDALDAFRSAEAAFRGERYAELDDVVEARQERARLTELRNCIIEERLELLRDATGHGYRVWEREGHRRVEDDVVIQIDATDSAAAGDEALDER